MLAFTMQFSRYGRNHSVLSPPSGRLFGRAVSNTLILTYQEELLPPGRGKIRAFAEKARFAAAAPSGPNSVLGTSPTSMTLVPQLPEGRAY